jgi:signal transduction histidine kinase
MSPQVQVIMIAAGCAGAVGAVGIGAIWLLRRASLRLSLMAASAIAVLAVVAGTLGTANAMFISQHDLRVVGMVCVVAGLVAFGISWLLGRQIEVSSLALRQAARSMGQDGSGFSPPAGPMSAELAALSRELGTTAGKLSESRERERRIDQSRRQLVAWVSHDLRTPLAGLQAMAEALQDGIATDPARYQLRMPISVTRARSGESGGVYTPACAGSQ